MRTILVVDDDTDIRELLERVLEGAGFRVVTAANGREAMLALGKERPSLVLLDLLMPVMDGWQLREAMLADPSLAPIPVVVLTGSEEAESPRASRVLPKPLRLPDLLDALRAA